LLSLHHIMLYRILSYFDVPVAMPLDIPPQIHAR